MPVYKICGLIANNSVGCSCSSLPNVGHTVTRLYGVASDALQVMKIKREFLCDSEQIYMFAFAIAIVHRNCFFVQTHENETAGQLCAKSTFMGQGHHVLPT